MKKPKVGKWDSNPHRLIYQRTNACTTLLFHPRGQKKSEILFCFKWNVHFFDSRSQRCFIINSLTGKVLSRCSKWAISCSNLCQCSLVLLVLRYHLLVSCQSPLYANFKSKQPQSCLQTTADDQDDLHNVSKKQNLHLQLQPSVPF